MIKNKDIIGSLDSNPFYFNHLNLNHFTLYYNGRPIPSEGLALDMSHEKPSVLAYNTLFEGSGILHSNAGLKLTHRMLIAGYSCCFVTLRPIVQPPKVSFRFLNRVIYDSNFGLTGHFPKLSRVCCTSNMITVCV